jgi:S-adenosylmethionine/arginine decarboxylase-like enzyme
MARNAWGYHLVVDMSYCDDKMSSEICIRAFFRDLIERLEMMPLTELVIARMDEEGNRGISAVQMITTSSITFHGDDETMSVYLDVFSCKRYDEDDVLHTIETYFRPKHVSSRMLYRNAG